MHIVRYEEAGCINGCYKFALLIRGSVSTSVDI
jgi:hypothetical protein